MDKISKFGGYGPLNDVYGSVLVYTLLRKQGQKHNVWLILKETIVALTLWTWWEGKKQLVFSRERHPTAEDIDATIKSQEQIQLNHYSMSQPNIINSLRTWMQKHGFYIP